MESVDGGWYWPKMKGERDWKNFQIGDIIDALVKHIPLCSLFLFQLGCGGGGGLGFSSPFFPAAVSPTFYKGGVKKVYFRCGLGVAIHSVICVVVGWWKG